MSIEVKFGDLVLDGVANWNSEIRTRVQAETFPRRHGAIGPDVTFLTERHVLLTGEVVKTSEALLDSYLDGLARRLVELGRDKLTFKSTDNRYLNAILSRYRTRAAARRIPALARGFDIDFLIADPFWYSTTESDSGLVQPDASPFVFPSALNNSGEAETPPRIEIKAVGANKSNIKITNTTTSLFMDFTGTITAGQTLILDHDDMTVDNGGSNALNDIASGSSFFSLVRGNNNISYTGPTSGVDITVYWTERYPT